MRNTYKTGASIHFDHHLKRCLRSSLCCLKEVKYQRWYRNDAYVRFRIYDESYKIIVDTSYHPIEENDQVMHKGKWTTYGQIPVYYNGDWVINATNWYDTLEEILYTCLQNNDWLADYETQGEIDKLATLIDAENIDFKKFGYEYIRKEGIGFRIMHSKELDELIDSFANKFIIYLNLEEDKFGALYQVMYLLATIICDCTIDEKERKRCETLQQ